MQFASDSGSLSHPQAPSLSLLIYFLNLGQKEKSFELLSKYHRGQNYYITSRYCFELISPVM